jgi:thiol-disulfide isomerase/thioredoxin
VTLGVGILLVAVVVAVVVGVLLIRRDGRFRPAQSETTPHVADLLPADLDADRWGERATLVHFSSAFCAPCRATRQVLTQVSSAVPGVEHVEVDAESHLELVRRLGIRRTPTVLVLDPDGRIRTRAFGQPRRADVLTAVSSIESRDDVP